MLASVRPHEAKGLGCQTTESFYSSSAPKPRPGSANVLDADGVPRRVPKLAVRNRTAEEGDANDRTRTAISEAASDNGNSTPPSSSSSQRSAPRSHSVRNLSDEAVDRKRWSANCGTSKTHYNAQTTKKRKNGGVLGFLALKEPSTSALAEFAAAEKEKARQKGGSGTNSAIPGVSTQKLPDHVPKVNSKWDGLPDSASRKSAESKATSRANTNSSFSTATRQSNWTAISSMSASSAHAKRPSESSSNRPVPWSAQSLSDGRQSSSSGSTRQPPALALIPESDPVEVTDENLPQTFLRDPSPPRQEHDFLPDPDPDPDPPMSPPELEGDDIFNLQELDANFPITPPADGSDTRPALMGIHYPELDSPNRAPVGVDVPTLLHDESMKEVVERKPSRTASSRRAINFSRPRSGKPTLPTLRVPSEPKMNSIEVRVSAADGVLLSPSLKDSSGRIDPFLTDTFASHSRETGHIPQRVASTIQKDVEQATSELPTQELSESPEFSPVCPQEQTGQSMLLPVQHPEETRPTSSTSTTTAIHDLGESRPRSHSEVSLVPSELSERWRMSPKDRLGLGSRVSRRSEVLPWETSEDILNNTEVVKAERLSRRLSWRIGSKK